jgi:hypothetical protein
MPGVGLDDLPEHRREALLWRHAFELDYDGVDDLVTSAAGSACERIAVDAGPEHDAVEGSDGRYHLTDGRRLTCANGSRRGRRSGVFPHEQHCDWWTRAGVYRIQPAPDSWGQTGDLAGVDGSAVVRWDVTVVGDPVDPALIRGRRRCVLTYPAHWPGYQGADSPTGRQRARLIAELGDRCHACTVRRGVIIDHDHFTGIVRGLVCAT